MSSPAQVAGDDDSQQPGLVDDLQLVTAREVQLRQEVNLLGKGLLQLPTSLDT